MWLPNSVLPNKHMLKKNYLLSLPYYKRKGILMLKKEWGTFKEEGMFKIEYIWIYEKFHALSLFFLILGITKLSSQTMIKVQ